MMARICQVLLIVMMAAVFAAPTSAQTRIVAVVNGVPITSYDVSQRQKLLRLTGQKGNLSVLALDELIDERIQDSAVKQARITISDAEVDAAVASIARNAKISPSQLAGAFQQAGVSIETLKARIRSQMGFGRLVRARFNATTAVSEQDLVAALLKDKERENVIDAPRYDLQMITIALPQAPSAARLKRAQNRAAEVRRKFASCKDGIDMARKTRNVVVKPVGRRMGIDFQPAIRKALEDTPVGKLTEPLQQPRGLVMFAVCDKTMVRSANAAMKELEPELAGAKGDSYAKQYLRQLKRDAVVDRRS
ncbi:MAG: SurA N-terminal domain-containing protein [Pseudomonadota bacterium]